MKSLARLTVAPLAPALAAALVLGLRPAAAPGDEIYTRPGQIAAAEDGARLNFYCMGSAAVLPRAS